MPESPAWLANHDSERAHHIFRRIHGPDASIKESIPHWDAPKTVTEEENLLQNSDRNRRDSIASRASHKASPPPIGFFAIVKDPFYQPAILAVVGIMVAQQFCGINSIMMYVNLGESPPSLYLRSACKILEGNPSEYCISLRCFGIRRISLAVPSNQDFY